MLYIVLTLLIIVAGYFAFKYFKLVYSLNKICQDLQEIRQNLEQNNMVRLPVPDKHLSKLLIVINSMLDGIQRERQSYGQREKNFQRQIENISHDLRTPLTVIVGYLKLLNKNADTELKETLTILEHKTEVMTNLVSQFYDYSRLSADDYDINLTSIDISRALREALLGNHQILSQKNLNIEVDIPNHPIWVLGEDAALGRIFSNLFQNAERYANSTLKISIKELDKCALISFTNDTNILCEEDVPHLFERFYMQDNSRNQCGTGLGLTVAKALSEEMEGNLEVTTLNCDNHNLINICFKLTLKLV